MLTSYTSTNCLHCVQTFTFCKDSGHDCAHCMQTFSIYTDNIHTDCTFCITDRQRMPSSHVVRFSSILQFLHVCICCHGNSVNKDQAVIYVILSGDFNYSVNQTYNVLVFFQLNISTLKCFTDCLLSKMIVSLSQHHILIKGGVGIFWP